MEPTTIEYKAQTVSPRITGETTLAVTDKGLLLTTPFDAEEIPFAGINALILIDYVVTVKADDGDYVFSKLGNWCKPFYDALCGAYNKAVLRSLFVKGEPVVTAKGEYSYTEAAGKAAGAAPVHVYENSVVVLPLNVGARRVPLCFMAGIEQGDFELTLKLDTGESYTWAKLGYDTAPFAGAIENQMRALREKSLAAVKEIDPSLSVAQAAQLAKAVPQGAAASFGQLSGMAPSFAAALEKKLEETRAADAYEAFKEICDPAKIYIGFRKNEAAAEEAAGEQPGLAAAGLPFPGGGLPFPGGGLSAPAEGLTAQVSDAAPAPEGETGDDDADEDRSQDPFLLWLIAPSPDGEFAAVEFAEKDAATFVYKTGGDFEGFARQLSRALEAIGFKREAIRLTEEELLKPEYADYYMASKRTAAMRFIRENFVGRVIHSSPETWKRKLMELWGAL